MLYNIFTFYGTKFEEYLLSIENGKTVKVDYDPALISLAQNTVKFARAVRNKVKNSYGGAKQKYQLMLDKIPLCFLDDLYDDPAVNILKYTLYSLVHHHSFPF